MCSAHFPPPPFSPFVAVLANESDKPHWTFAHGGGGKTYRTEGGGGCMIEGRAVGVDRGRKNYLRRLDIDRLAHSLAPFKFDRGVECVENLSGNGNNIFGY